MFRIIVIAVKLIKPVIHIRSINGKVTLTVLFYNFFLTIFEIRNYHLSVLAEVIHAADYAIIIVRNPHISIFVHLAAGCIKDVIIISDFLEALCKITIFIIVGKSICFNKSGKEKLSVGIKAVRSGLYRKVIRLGNPISLVHYYFASGGFCVIVAATDMEQTLTDFYAINVIEF